MFRMAQDVLASTEARTRFPEMIEELVAHPEETYVVGRQRRREIVVMSVSRYDELVERESALGDLAWMLFADERVEHPSGPPVGWEEAQRRRARRP
jgi:PHD/YefM family antitoxin component YafN of YafNO toxin-antitoxin module